MSDNHEVTSVEKQDRQTIAVILHRVLAHLANPAFKMTEQQMKGYAAQLQEIIDRDITA